MEAIFDCVIVFVVFYLKKSLSMLSLAGWMIIRITIEINAIETIYLFIQIIILKI